jgi:hypothetical protein
LSHAALRDTRSGNYFRKLCYVREQFTRRTLTDVPAGVDGGAAPLFDAGM